MVSQRLASTRVIAWLGSLALAMLFLPPAPAFDAVLLAEALGPALLGLARAGTQSPTHH